MGLAAALRFRIADRHFSRLSALISDVLPVDALQRMAAEGSRLGIPLPVGRDAITAIHTVKPIPLGRAACRNADVVRKGARIAAREAATTGVSLKRGPKIAVWRDVR